MKIRRCPIVLHNVVSAKSNMRLDEWHDGIIGIRNAVIRNELYGVGPVMYQVDQVNLEEETAEFTYYIPVNQQVVLNETNEYGFDESWQVEDALVFRHADLDDDISESYALLRACAEANELTLQEPFYNIYLDVFGGGVIDICAPIVKEE